MFYLLDTIFCGMLAFLWQVEQHMSNFQFLELQFQQVSRMARRLASRPAYHQR